MTTLFKKEQKKLLITFKFYHGILLPLNY